MHYFNVASNLCQRFKVGYPEEDDNFWLVGETYQDKPLVSCRVYDEQGDFLYGLDRNKLSANTPGRFRFMLTKEGWHQVVDDKGDKLLRIESRLDQQRNKVTQIFGRFFDKHGRLAAEGVEEKGLLVSCPFRM